MPTGSFIWGCFEATSKLKLVIVTLFVQQQLQPQQPRAGGHQRVSGHKDLRKAEEVIFKANFSFFTGLSAAETHTFGAKFIGLYGTVICIAIRDFSC